MNSKRVALQASFLALALVLYLIESLFIPPLPFPGAKLGLANLVTIILIYIFSWKEGLFNSVMRTILGSIISGTILAPSFIFSFSGAVISTLVMAFFISSFKSKFSPVGIGIWGALGHNLAQLSVAIILAAHFGLIALLPALIVFSIISGFVTGFVSAIGLKRLSMLDFQIKYQNIY